MSGATLDDVSQSQVVLSEPSDLKVGSADSLLEGLLMKAGFSVLSMDELKRLPNDRKRETLVAKWAPAGRTNRGHLGGYSQEVIVTLSEHTTGSVVYRGVGEYIGRTEIDDIKGALQAATQALVRK